MPSIIHSNEINGVLESFNTDRQATIQDPFNSLNFMNGIQAGFLYRLNQWALGVNWHRMNKNLNVLQFFESNNTFESSEYNFTLSSWSLGFEYKFGHVKAGSNIHLQSVKTRQKIGVNNLSLVNDNYVSIEYNLGIYLGGSDVVSLLLEPFYNMPLGSVDISNFHNRILNDNTSEKLETIHYWGIKLVFVNGPR